MATKWELKARHTRASAEQASNVTAVENKRWTEMSVYSDHVSREGRLGVDIKAILLAWNIALTIVLGILISNHHFVDPSLYESVKTAEAQTDLSIAVELGRLDFASALLSIVGILVGLGALVGYTEVRWRAIEQGRQAAIPAATEAARQPAEEEARRVVADLLPPLVARTVGSYIRTSTELGREDFSKDEMSEMIKNLDDNGGGNGKP